MLAKRLFRWCAVWLPALLVAIVALLIWRRPPALTQLFSGGSRAFYANPAPWRYDAEVLLGSDTLAEVYRNGSILSCRLTIIMRETDRELIRATFPQLREISRKEMLSVIQACGRAENMGLNGSDSFWTRFSPKRLLLYPGTLWCGPGDGALNYSHLGASRELDRCCRDHDFCPVKIYSGQPKFGLRPPYMKAAMLCECDLLFEQCLKRAEDLEEQAAKVRYYYFKLYSPHCLTESDGRFTLVKYADIYQRLDADR